MTCNQPMHTHTHTHVHTCIYKYTHSDELAEGLVVKFMLKTHFPLLKNLKLA